ncbi:MAG: hypothetical protein ACT4O0_03470 [Pseudonocardia sp.]
MRVVEIEIDDGNTDPVHRPRRWQGPADNSLGSGNVSDYESKDDREALEAEFNQLQAETGTVEDVSTVVSVRLRTDELASLERAAGAAGVPLSTFIRQASLGAAHPLDVRAASARAEAIQSEARKLIALLHGEVA